MSLSVELVPSTCWYSNVRSNVSPADWNKCKQYVRERSGNRCEICGGRGSRWAVECHEIWSYTRASEQFTRTQMGLPLLPWVQRLTGLIALCPSCHEVKHIGRAEAVGRYPQALKHLMKVNQWTREQAESYLNDVFSIWTNRSTVQWELDISWLETINIRTPSQNTASQPGNDSEENR